MKILPNFYDRITAGIKRWEIREELPLSALTVFKYIDATDGSTLGYHKLKKCYRAHTPVVRTFNDVKQATIELEQYQAKNMIAYSKAEASYTLSAFVLPSNVKI